MADLDFDTVEKLMEGKETVDNVAKPVQNRNPSRDRSGKEVGGTNYRRGDKYIDAASERTYRDSPKRKYDNSNRYRDDSDNGSNRDRNNWNRRNKKHRRNSSEFQEPRKPSPGEQSPGPVDDAQRDDLTVLAMNLPLRVSDRTIHDFFHKNAGPVRDIQVIRDQKSGIPKGVAYIEFKTQEAVIKALSLSGNSMEGQAIKVQPSHAEKNRAARIAKIQQAEVADGTLRLYVANLVDILSNLTANEVKQLFTPFGEIIGVDMPKEPYSGKPKGYAYLQFRRATEAREALMAMNNNHIGGVRIRVGYASDRTGTGPDGYPFQSKEALWAQQLAAGYRPDVVEMDRLDEDADQGLLHDAGSKQALMQKLMRSDPSTMAMLSQGAAVGYPNNYSQYRMDRIPLLNRPAAAGYITSSIPTVNLVLSNMFSPADINLCTDPNFFEDVIEDVKEECARYGTVVQSHIKKDNPDGQVWLRFANVSQSQAAYKALHGRYFGGKSILAEYIHESAWLAATRR